MIYNSFCFLIILIASHNIASFLDIEKSEIKIYLKLELFSSHLPIPSQKKMASPKRLFLTGASGFVGPVIVEQAIKQNYEVHALSRTESSDTKLRSLHATPVRGDLSSLDVLKQESSQADAVIHLATAYVLGQGSYDDIAHIDIAAVDAIADGLAGSNKPLVVTSGTLAVLPDPTGAETTEASPQPKDGPVVGRNKTEEHSLALASRGIRVTGVRLAAYTYGRGGANIARFLGMAGQFHSVMCVDGGKNHISTVHVDDAAEVFLLAVQKGKAGEIFNATSATDVKGRDLFGAIAAAMDVPVRDVSFADAAAQIGDTFAWFLQAENRASGAKARKELGWQPKELGILDDISKGSYKAVAQQIKQGSA